MKGMVSLMFTVEGDSYVIRNFQQQDYSLVEQFTHNFIPHVNQEKWPTDSNELAKFFRVLTMTNNCFLVVSEQKMVAFIVLVETNHELELEMLFNSIGPQTLDTKIIATFSDYLFANILCQKISLFNVAVKTYEESFINNGFKMVNRRYVRRQGNTYEACDLERVK